MILHIQRPKTIWDYLLLSGICIHVSRKRETEIKYYSLDFVHCSHTSPQYRALQVSPVTHLFYHLPSARTGTYKQKCMGSKRRWRERIVLNYLITMRGYVYCTCRVVFWSAFCRVAWGGFWVVLCFVTAVVRLCCSLVAWSAVLRRLCCVGWPCECNMIRHSALLCCVHNRFFFHHVHINIEGGSLKNVSNAYHVGWSLPSGNGVLWWSGGMECTDWRSGKKCCIEWRERVR